MPINKRPVTINKIGGKNMSQLDEVGALVDVLKNRREAVTLVVSAFSGVTNALIGAMDELNGTDYSEDDIDRAFGRVAGLHTEMIFRFFNPEYVEEARNIFWNEYQNLKQALLDHKSAGNTILMPTEDSYQIRDQVIGFGEKMGGNFLKVYLEQKEYMSHFFDNVACKKGVFSKESPVSNTLLHKETRRGIQESLDAVGETRGDVIRIFGGHVKGMPRGIAVDVGRSYTDTTAVNVALALRNRGENVTETRFWKDVPGVLTASPKDLNEDNNPIVHSDVSMEEALEMAAAGSQLMQVDALSLAAQHDLDLRLLDIREAKKNQGTSYSNARIETRHAFKSIISNPHVDTINITIPEMANRSGFGAAILGILAERNINLDGFFTEGTSITFSVPMPQDKSDREEKRNQVREALQALREININNECYKTATLSWSKDASACVSVIGNELVNIPGILSEISGVLGAYGVNIKAISHGENQIRIMILIDKSSRKRAVRLLHSIFVDGDRKVIAEYEQLRLRRLEELTSTFK